MNQHLKRIKVDTYLDKEERRIRRVNGIRLGVHLHPRCRCGTILVHRYKELGRCKSCYESYRDYKLDELQEKLNDERAYVKELENTNGELQDRNETLHEANVELAEGIQRLLETRGSLRVPVDELKTYANRQRSTCVICLSTIEKGDHIFDIPCNHKYHTHCLFRVAMSTENCPMCRKHLVAEHCV